MSKPSNCKCGSGGFTIHGHKWVILQRRPWPGTCHFKCLTCGWKWWTKKRYASKCPDHSERSRSGMTDQDILQRLVERSLIVNEDGTAVYSVRAGNPRPIRIINRKKNGSSYRFVEISHQGRKKKIALHRLVWMSANKTVVPDGYDIDHVNGKSVEYPDSIENLRLLESSANRSRGYVSPTPELPFEDEVPF